MGWFCQFRIDQSLARISCTEVRPAQRGVSYISEVGLGYFQYLVEDNRLNTRCYLFV